MLIAHFRQYGGIALLMFLGSVAASAQGTFPTNEDLRHFRAINDPRPSPDGQTVLYRITESTADGAQSHLWMTDVASHQPRQLTFAPGGKLEHYHGETAGGWMPDGSGILFIAKRGE